ncbi:MAG: RNA chaperone Hfq, partial [Stenotrophobium sp.]
SQMVYKHAISTVVPARAVRVYDADSDVHHADAPGEENPAEAPSDAS